MQATRRAALLGLGLTATAAPAFAAVKPAAGKAARKVLSDLQAAQPIPALGAAAARAGGLIWAEALGQADLELGAPAAPAHRFRIGSCSKVVTAVTVARLMDRGVVDLDAPIGGYRPSLPEAHRKTTLRQLLGHQGGVRHYNGRDINPMAPGGTLNQHTWRNTEEVLKIFIDDPLMSPPGETYRYSTFGFSLIGAVIEAASGKSFHELVAQEVSDPLGLSIVADLPSTVIAGRVKPYAPMPPGVSVDGFRVVNADPVNPAYKWPGGGLMASASDLARLGAALLTPGYLKAETLKTLFAPQTPSKGPGPLVVGLAWRIDTDTKGRRRFHHAGSIEGGRAGVAIYPDQGLAVALTSNLSDAPGDPLPALGLLADALV
jgi:serine beta-lactamase-like protein LACTB